jgi:hypothetical protein
MVRDVNHHCQTCVACKIASAQTKGSAIRQAGPEHYLGCFKVFHVDHVGPFPQDRGFRYVLSVRDSATLFNWLIPVKEKTAEEAARVLLAHVFTLVGYPIIIRSDRGFGNAGSASLSRYLQAYGIYHAPTLPYSPQASGLVEALHKPLRQVLYKYASHNKKWVDLMPFISWILRTTPLDALGGISPYEAVFARKPRHAFADALRSSFGGIGGVEAHMKQAEEFSKCVEESAQLFRQESAQLRRARQLGEFGASVHPRFAVGDLVVVKNNQQQRSLLQGKNHMALYKVKEAREKFVILSNLDGSEPTRWFATGKLPLHNVAVAVSANAVPDFLAALDSIPTEDEMLGTTAAQDAQEVPPGPLAVEDGARGGILPIENGAAI